MPKNGSLETSFRKLPEFRRNKSFVVEEEGGLDFPSKGKPQVKNLRVRKQGTLEWCVTVKKR